MRERVEDFIRRGVEKGLNLDDPGALAELMKAVEADREKPVGYAYLAMAHLFFYETAFSEGEKKKHESSMLRAVEDTQSRADTQLGKDPKNAEACFALAISRMVKNRWEILRKKYFRAFREAQGVWDLLETTQELEPQNFDVYYPMGGLHYHLAQLSGIARWVTSLFITSGDREKGLKEFETAHEKGRIMKDLAASSLVSPIPVMRSSPPALCRWMATTSASAAASSFRSSWSSSFRSCAASSPRTWYVDAYLAQSAQQTPLWTMRRSLVERLSRPVAGEQGADSGRPYATRLRSPVKPR